jgi:hypothetical protein
MARPLEKDCSNTIKKAMLRRKEIHTKMSTTSGWVMERGNRMKLGELHEI